MKKARCSLPPAAAAELVEEIIARLKEQGMRRTPALDFLLGGLATDHRPKTLAQVARFPGLEHRDHTTIYRLVGKLEAAGVVRRLGLQGNRSHYELLVPSHHHDYLVCRDCGCVEEAPTACHLDSVEAEIMETSGWGEIAHELEFHGRCPDCRTAGADQP